MQTPIELHSRPNVLALQSSVISTDDDQSLRLESFVIMNLGGVSTKLFSGIYVATN